MQYIFEQPVHGSAMEAKYQCTISWRNGTFISDEPVSSGGGDTGPDPYVLLLASLASCTLITLRMYIERKGWEIKDISVDTNLFQGIKDGKIVTTIDRDIRYADMVTEEQRNRLQEIAMLCPISKLIQNEVKVRTFTHSDADTEKKLKYTNGDVTVVWKPDLCRHSGRCVSGLPQVFDVHAKPWINAQAAATDAIIAQVNKCPTGALSFEMNKQD